MAQETVMLRLIGMHCAACVRAVELGLTGLDGVSSASVNLAEESGEVTFDPATVGPERIVEAIARHVAELNAYLATRLEPLADEFELLGPEDPAARHGITTLVCRRRGLVSLWDEDVAGIAAILDHRANVMVRSGELCVHSWFTQRGISRERDKLRASVYAYNTREECDAFADALEQVVALDEYQMLPRMA